MTYNASKAAVISLSKALAREMAPHSILVNSVAPGSTLFPGGSWDRRQRENPAQIAQFVKDGLPAWPIRSPRGSGGVGGLPCVREGQPGDRGLHHGRWLSVPLAHLTDKE